MCRYNLHHNPSCGHIASFGMESCTKIIISMRQGKSDMYCEDSSFTCDLVISQEAGLCDKCKAESSANRTRDNNDQQQYAHIEGMDLVSNGYPYGGSSTIHRGEVTKQALSTMRCVLHRCLPLDIPFEAGCESDNEQPQQCARKSPSVAPAELEADLLHVECAQSPTVELSAGCEIMAPPPTVAWSPAYPPTYPVAVKDHTVSDRLLTERLLEISPKAPAVAPAQPEHALAKSWCDEISELSGEPLTTIEDEFTYMRDEDFKYGNSNEDGETSAEKEMDTAEDIDDDFVNILQHMANSNVPTIDLKSSSDEGKGKTKPKAKPRKKMPHLAPIITNLPVRTDISIAHRVTPSPDMEVALNQAIIECASLPSPRFKILDYERTRSDKPEQEDIESPRGTRPMDNIDSLGEESSYQWPVEDFPPKIILNFFQPLSPTQEAMVDNSRESEFGGESLGEINFFDPEDWPDSAQEISRFSDNSDSLSDDEQDLMLAGNEDYAGSVCDDSMVNSSFENDSHTMFDSQVHRVSDTTIESETHDPEDPTRRDTPLIAPKPVRPLQDIVSHLSDEEWELVPEAEAQESASNEGLGVSLKNGGDPWFSNPTTVSERSSTKKLDPESSYEAWLQSVKDARQEWLAQVPVTYRNGYAIMLNGTICLPMINTESVEPRKRRLSSPPGLDPVPRFHPEHVDYSRFLYPGPTQAVYAPPTLPPGRSDAQI